jgi:hypothetical protein
MLLDMTILETLETAIALEFERTGIAAFGLLQGATYYTNHLAIQVRKLVTMNTSEIFKLQRLMISTKN